MDIKWEYFFGGATGKSFDRYYKAFIKGHRVEKHASNNFTKYAIGEMCDDVTLYNTENELIKAIEKMDNEFTEEKGEITAKVFLRATGAINDGKGNYTISKDDLFAWFKNGDHLKDFTEYDTI